MMNYLFTKLEIIESCKWIKVIEVANKAKVLKLTEIIDLGEAEAIVLAKETSSELLIIDERLGRSIANKHGLETIGLLGILVNAKQKGLIKKLKPILSKLVNDVGFRVSEKLYQLILNTVNELD